MIFTLLATNRYQLKVDALHVRPLSATKRILHDRSFYPVPIHYNEMDPYMQCGSPSLSSSAGILVALFQASTRSCTDASTAMFLLIKTRGPITMVPVINININSRRSITMNQTTQKVKTGFDALADYVAIAIHLPLSDGKLLIVTQTYLGTHLYITLT